MPIDDALEKIQGSTLKEIDVLEEEKLYDIEAILNGQTFYSNKRDSSDNHIGLPIALQQALEYTGSEGIVVTMPELIATKSKADKDHEFWNNWYSVHTEENIGIDKKGIHYSTNEWVLVVVNGGGILTPDRIRQAYDEGLLNSGATKYRDNKMGDLLDGILPTGERIELYTIEDVKNGVSNLPHRFGVVMPYSMAKGTNPGRHQKREFIENPLVIARAGGIENLEAYFEKAKDTSDDTLGNYHPFLDRTVWVAQGRMLWFDYGSYGMYGNSSLDNNGRFIGVGLRELKHGFNK